MTLDANKTAVRVPGRDGGTFRAGEPDGRLGTARLGKQKGRKAEAWPSALRLAGYMGPLAISSYTTVDLVSGKSSPRSVPAYRAISPHPSERRATELAANRYSANTSDDVGAMPTSTQCTLAVVRPLQITSTESVKAGRRYIRRRSDFLSGIVPRNAAGANFLGLLLADGGSG